MGYVALGALATIVTAWLAIRWDDIVASWSGERFGVDEQPLWSRASELLVIMSPWLGAVPLLLLTRRRLPTAAYLAGVILSYAVLAGGFLFGHQIDIYINQQRFEKSAWAEPAADGRAPTHRQLMVDDLVNRKLLIGLSEGEVFALLGHEYDEWADQDYEKAIVYLLGPDPAFGIDNEWLMVLFGPDQRVAAVIVTTR